MVLSHREEGMLSSLGFMSGEDVEGWPKDFDSGINKGPGLMPGVRQRNRIDLLWGRQRTRSDYFCINK